jgi:membrane protein DedA with SNARE-associated domain
LLAALEELFVRHMYTAILLATFLEGVGLPLPAEVLFVAAALSVHRGDANLGAVIALAVAGNVTGACLGFSLAYVGGKRLVQRVARAIRLKPEALDSVERFFGTYGSGTVFLSRFIGFIRAATIYSAGAARMAPLRFFIFALAGALIWNAGWAWLAYRFGRSLPGLIHRVVQHGAPGFGAVLLLLLAGLALYNWLRRRKPIRP